jgi:hypothetical protein
VASWFYDDKPLQWTKFVNGPSYRSWNLPLPVVRGAHLFDPPCIKRAHECAMQTACHSGSVVQSTTTQSCMYTSAQMCSTISADRRSFMHTCR